MRAWNIIGALLVVTAAFTCGDANLARAQDRSPYDDVEIELDEDVVWTNVGISLRRDPAMPLENFIINLSAAERYSTGCPPLKDMGFETEYKNDTLEIKLLGLTVDQSEFPYYKCNGKPRNPKADVVLNKKDLMDNGVKKISIIDGPLTKTYAAEITDEKIELSMDENCKVKSMNGNDCSSVSITTIRMQSVDGVKNPLRLWFYPEGTLLLYTPGAEGDRKQIRGKIHELAAGMGLTPLEDMYAEFKTPLVRDDYSYFVDKGARYKDATVDGGSFGNVSIEKMAYGLEGDVSTTEKVEVFARRPGAYD